MMPDVPTNWVDAVAVVIFVLAVAATFIMNAYPERPKR
jgi:hypothetical protein